MSSIPVKKIATWILRVVVAMLFLATAAFKLSGQPMMVAEFQSIGLGQGFRYVTGCLELFGALLVLVPRFSVWGVILLLCIIIGAFVTQAFVLHGDIIHTIVISVVLVLLILLQKEKLDTRRPA